VAKSTQRVAPAETAGIAFVGCGFVADFYRARLIDHADAVHLTGVFDTAGERTAAFARRWGDPVYPSLSALLDDPGVDIVVNLTPPHAHVEITQAAIEVGKHVYTEKPLAMTAAEATALAAAAGEKGVLLSAAPCNLLGEQAQTLWRAVHEGRVGRVALVYAELDDGMIHRCDYRNWRSLSGAPWPARGEFEVGCTFEHAGYAVTLLAAMFGPVRRVDAFSTVAVPNKGVEPPLEHCAPDVSVGCLTFDDGVVARLTNSVVAPYDHRLRVIGEEGVLQTDEYWDYRAPVRLRSGATGRLARAWERRFGLLRGRVLAPVRRPHRRRRGQPAMDFMRGVREMADALRENRRPHLDADFAVHVTEVTEILQYPDHAGPQVRSTFAPITLLEAP
jgi:predicted dehydrogenase